MEDKDKDKGPAGRRKRKEPSNHQKPPRQSGHRYRNGWRVIRFAATIDLTLMLTQSSVAATQNVLPLGGGQLQQLGLCFGVAFVIAEFIELLRPP